MHGLYSSFGNVSHFETQIHAQSKQAIERMRSIWAKSAHCLNWKFVFPLCCRWPVIVLVSLPLFVRVCDLISITTNSLFSAFSLRFIFFFSFPAFFLSLSHYVCLFCIIFSLRYNDVLLCFPQGSIWYRHIWLACHKYNNMIEEYEALIGGYEIQLIIQNWKGIMLMKSLI